MSSNIWIRLDGTGPSLDIRTVSIFPLEVCLAAGFQFLMPAYLLLLSFIFSILLFIDTTLQDFCPVFPLTISLRPIKPPIQNP